MPILSCEAIAKMTPIICGTRHRMAAGIGVPEGIIVDIAVAIEILRVLRVRDQRIRTEEPAYGRIVVAGLVVIETGVIEFLPRVLVRHIDGGRREALIGAGRAIGIDQTDRTDRTDRTDQINRARRLKTVSPSFPHPNPVRLLAGPQARSHVCRLWQQLSRAMHMKCWVGDCSGKPHSPVMVSSQHCAPF